MGRGLFAARVDMNNLRRSPLAVDKWPVVPAVRTALSTGLSGAPMQGLIKGLVAFGKSGEILKPPGVGAAAAWPTSEMPRVAQLQVVLTGVGLFDAAVGAVLDAQLPFVLVCGAVVETDGQVRHKVEAGANAAFEESGAVAAIGSQSPRGADAEDAAAHPARGFVRGPRAGIRIPVPGW